MIVGIHNTWPHKPDYISDVYRHILKANNIEYIDLDSSQPDFWEKIEKIDCFIYRWAHTDYHHQHAKTIIPIIEQMYNKSCFPNQATCWHYDDKVKQSLMLKANHFPTCNFSVFWDKKPALDWVKNKAEYPFVFKLKSGSGSLQVKLVKNKRAASKYVKKMFNRGISTSYQGVWATLKTFNFSMYKTFKSIAKSIYYTFFPLRIKPYWTKQQNYFYTQEFQPNNSYDTRVQITGKRAFAFVRYNRENDFRASGSNKWTLDHNKIDMEFVKIAFDVSKKFGFQSMAYDFIYDKNKNPVIVEISYCFGDYPEFSNGYWDEDLVWHKGRFLPQYFELVDLLENDTLILPEEVKPSSSYKNVKA